jgi:hypothetical protein
MKIYKAYVEIICGEYSFGNTCLFVAKNKKEAEKMLKEYIKEENSLYPGETFYKCDGVDEFDFIDGYKINYKLEKLKRYEKN